MGREYARLEGETDEVSTAIHEHYMPVRAGGDLPASMTGAIVSLADRMDTVVGCFGIGQLPTGTTDPFGLRRLTIGLLAILEDKNLHLPLHEFICRAIDLYGDKLTENREDIVQQVIAFIRGRFVNDLVSRGLSASSVEAGVASGFNDIVDCRMRIDALLAISSRPEFTLLAGSFKRVKNIIKTHSLTTVDTGLLTETAEKELYTSLLEVERQVTPLLAKAEYENALLHILAMKEPIDTFFDDVMVMSEDEAQRNNRLSLLTAITQLFQRIGDFSKMYTLQ